MGMTASPSPPAPDLAAVLALAGRGWRVFPCRSCDKTPLVREWQHVATTEEQQIRAWYEQHSGCNWGIATGRESGIWVLDVDGPKGEASLKNLIEQYGHLSSGFTVRTGKGLHLYFAWPATVTLRNSASRVGDGLDVRGDGGYVLAPGSIHPSGAVYRVVRDEPVPDAPDWLIQMAAAPATEGVASREDGHRADTRGDTIVKGNRNAVLASLAGTMRKRGMTPEAIEVALLAENGGKCSPPLSEAEVRAIARSVSRYTPGTSVRAPGSIRLIPESPSSPRRADIVTLADVQPRDVDWLWQPYLPAGMLTMLSGDPGTGKTYVALAVAAALTTGHTPYSRELCMPADVLYLSVENDPACVLRPRFDAIGGDPSRFHLLRGSFLGDDRDGVWLTDIVTLRDALDKTNARLMVVDPIQSYLGAEVDAYRANETRPVLDGLARLAEEYHCSVLLVRHLTKARGGRAIHAGLGGIDLTGAVRCEMLAGCSAEDPQKRAMIHVKSNVGKYGAPLGYAIDDRGVFSWTGETTLTQSDILAPEARHSSAQDDAAEWLRTYLGHGPCPQKELEAAAKDAGIAWRTVRRAKKTAGVTSRKVAFGDGWVWELASTAESEGGQDVHRDTLAPLGEVGPLRPVVGEL